MNIIITLFLVLIGIEVARLVLSFKKPTKKMFFKNELYFLIKRIWNKEFEMFQKKAIREGIRKEYDYMNARLDKVKTDIENWPKDQDEGEKKRREDDKVRTETEINSLSTQMKAFDLEIYGCKPSAEYPDGVSGIEGDIEALKAIQYDLEDWIKNI